MEENATVEDTEIEKDGMNEVDLGHPFVPVTSFDRVASWDSRSSKYLVHFLPEGKTLYENTLLSSAHHHLSLFLALSHGRTRLANSESFP